jgi:hypothetical protein
MDHFNNRTQFFVDLERQIFSIYFNSHLVQVFVDKQTPSDPFRIKQQVSTTLPCASTRIHRSFSNESVSLVTVNGPFK